MPDDVCVTTKKVNERLSTNDRSNRVSVLFFVSISSFSLLLASIICRHCRYFRNLYTAAAARPFHFIRLSLNFFFSLNKQKSIQIFLFSTDSIGVWFFFRNIHTFFSQERLFTQILFVSVARTQISVK